MKIGQYKNGIHEPKSLLFSLKEIFMKLNSKACLEPSQTSMMQLFLRKQSMVKRLFSQKISIVDTRLSSKYAPEIVQIVLFWISFIKLKINACKLKGYLDVLS